MQIILLKKLLLCVLCLKCVKYILEKSWLSVSMFHFQNYSNFDEMQYQNLIYFRCIPIITPDLQNLKLNFIKFLRNESSHKKLKSILHLSRSTQFFDIVNTYRNTRKKKCCNWALCNGISFTRDLYLQQINIKEMGQTKYKNTFRKAYSKMEHTCLLSFLSRSSM